MSIVLNGFQVDCSSQTFTAYVHTLPDPKQLYSLRNQIGQEWFTYWRKGKVYGIPLVDRPHRTLGKATTLSLKNHDHRHVLNARFNDCLPSCFRVYAAFRYRPFSFLAQKSELVSKVTAGWNNLPPLVQQFKIRPKYELDSRLIELRDGETTIGLFLSVNTRWEIFARVDDLQKAGIDLSGLHVIRRNPTPEHRRLSSLQKVH